MRPTRKNTAAAPIPTNASISASQHIEHSAPTAVHEIDKFKNLLEAEKQKGVLLQQTIEILKSDKAFLQDQLTKKEDFIHELMEKKPEASGAGVKPPKKSSEICITDDSSEESAGKESSGLSDSSAETVDYSFKKGQMKRKKQSHSQRDEKSPKPKDVSDHIRVRMRNTRGILSRYIKALKAFQEGNSMKNAFDSVGVDRCTIARTSAIAELKIAAPEVFKALPPWNERVEKLSTFVERCRSAMTIEIKEKIKKMKSDDELLPFANSM